MTRAVALLACFLLACQGKEAPTGSVESIELPTSPDPVAKPVPTRSLATFDVVERDNGWGDLLVTAKVRNTNSRRVMFYPRATVFRTTFSNYGTSRETSVKDSSTAWVYGPTYAHQLAPQEVGVLGFSMEDWSTDTQVYNIEYQVLTSGVDLRSFMRGEMILSNLYEYVDHLNQGSYIGQVMNATNAVLADVRLYFWLFDDQDRFTGMARAHYRGDTEWLPGREREVELSWDYEEVKQADRWEFHPTFIPLRTIP